MFGYVKVLKPELKIREYEAYKGVYCTLCKTLGKEYGQLSRMMLSYDATFYVLLLSMAQKEAPCFQVGRCPFNPAKKCQYQTNHEALYQRAAALTMILSYHKVKDDLKEAAFSKKCLARLSYPFMARQYKKAKQAYPRFAEIAENAMQQQASIEQENTASTDRAADPSSKALAELFTDEMADTAQRTVLYHTAYCIGRFVYLIDAYDDMRDDFKHKNYNPYLVKFQIQDGQQIFAQEIQTEILESLHRTVNEAALGFNLLEGSLYRGILENIFYDGLENQILTVQKSYEKVKENHDESL